MTGRFGNAIDNFLIIMVAVAIVLLLVVMLGSGRNSASSWCRIPMPQTGGSRWNSTGNIISQERDLCVNQIVERIRHAP